MRFILKYSEISVIACSFIFLNFRKFLTTVKYKCWVYKWSEPVVTSFRDVLGGFNKTEYKQTREK